MHDSPIQPTIKRPNAETLQVMEELENGGGKVFQTASLVKSFD
jgi:hypothetical protein